MAPAFVLGIDPGHHGGLCWYNTETGGLVIHDMPITYSRGRKGKAEIALPELARLIDQYATDTMAAVIEKVGPMPGQGISSTWAFAEAYMAVKAMVASAFIPMTLVPPQTWKRDLRVPAAKDGALARADQLMPRHCALWRGPRGGLMDGRAESALLAYWGTQKVWGGGLNAA